MDFFKNGEFSHFFSFDIIRVGVKKFYDEKKKLPHGWDHKFRHPSSRAEAAMLAVSHYVPEWKFWLGFW